MYVTKDLLQEVIFDEVEEAIDGLNLDRVTAIDVYDITVAITDAVYSYLEETVFDQDDSEDDFSEDSGP
jgi:hypothetical protein